MTFGYLRCRLRGRLAEWANVVQLRAHDYIRVPAARPVLLLHTVALWPSAGQRLAEPGPGPAGTAFNAVRERAPQGRLTSCCGLPDGGGVWESKLKIFSQISPRRARKHRSGPVHVYCGRGLICTYLCRGDRI